MSRPAGLSNGVLFSLGARLARFTGNKTSADWADKTWDWMTKVSLIDSKSFAVYDGAHVEDDCKKISKYEFSGVHAVFAMGAAYMYNYVSRSAPLHLERMKHWVIVGQGQTREKS